MHSRIVFDNENCDCYVPVSKIVDGHTFVKLEPKDRTFFKFATGHSLRLGKKFDDSRYLLKFFQDMVKARTDGCQAAFAKLQAELREEDQDARRAQGQQPPEKRARIRCRAIREDDRETVGDHIMVSMQHDDSEKDMRVLFGIKSTPLWVEANESNMEFIKACLSIDYKNSRFAATRPRGQHFRKAEGHAHEPAEPEADDKSDEPAEPEA